jgi:hypothetical protein
MNRRWRLNGTRVVQATLMTLAVLSLSGSLAVTGQETPTALEGSAKQAEDAGRIKDAFDLYVKAIQALRDPVPLADDARLRERAIVLAGRLTPRPALPEDAERFGVQGQVMYRDAKDKAGFEKSEVLLRKAVRTAPWVPTLAFNLALVQEKLEFFRSAAANLKLYLLSAPADAADVRAKMYEFELKKDSDPASAAREDCALGDKGGCNKLAAQSNEFFAKAVSSAGADDSLRRESFRQAYLAADFVCSRGRLCAELGRLLLYAWISDMPGAKYVNPDPFGADSLKAMGVVADGNRAAALLVDSCRKQEADFLFYVPAVHPCTLLHFAYLGVIGLEERMTRKSENTDRLFSLPLAVIQCPGTPADCLAKGVMLEGGMGQKKADKGAAKKAYDLACKAGLQDACDRLKKL